MTARQRSPIVRLERLVDSLVELGAVSSVVALVGGPRGIEWGRAAGWARRGIAAHAADVATRFDFASLTKPVVATLALTLDATGELPLATRLGEVAEPGEVSCPAGWADRQLAELLRHGVGMQAWTPLYARCRGVDEARALLRSGELTGARAGTYSDLDFLVWGFLAERALGRPLASLVGERVLGPLGMTETSAFGGIGGMDAGIVAESLMDTGREVELAAGQGYAIEPLPAPAPGEPQDGNARFLTAAMAASESATVSPSSAGFLCGHGGLFGTAADLWRLGAEWLAPGRLLQESAVAAALAPSGGQTPPARPGLFALGWWRRRHRGSGGPALSASAFGHSGFAGGSLWIDPPSSRIYVLLGHRIAPSVNLNRWRRRFHAAASRAFAARARSINDTWEASS